MAIYKRLSKTIDSMRIEEASKGIAPREIVLFDVCSGKGNLTTLLSFMFPLLKIFMVDKDKKMNIEHISKLPNVRMEYMDIYQKKFVEFVQRETAGKVGIFFGSHLCGDLSEIVVDTFNVVPTLEALILAPCCLSKRKRQIADTAARLRIDNYQYWTTHLYHMVDFKCRRNIEADENVYSTKNNYIVAVKSISPVPIVSTTASSSSHG
eukprot:TRINITY_DN1769_c0_g2_i1.p1 TRINITY_DN1769_c0_g2~~TRINITY_DN1769_c0_g2_i1.p1  ORF type:complete len:208 (-),score=28.41 TRINITY_DN1769_c0_g2_i1:63-686(-)